MLSIYTMTHTLMFSDEHLFSSDFEALKYFKICEPAVLSK